MANPPMSADRPAQQTQHTSMPGRKRIIVVGSLVVVAAASFLWAHDLRTRPLGEVLPPGGAPLELEPEAYLEGLRRLVTPDKDGRSYRGLVPMYEEARRLYDTRRLYSNLIRAAGAITLLLASVVAWQWIRSRRTAAGQEPDPVGPHGARPK